jgi:phage shock protein A
METVADDTLERLAEVLTALIQRVDAMEKKIESDLAGVGDTIVSSIFRLAAALQSRVSDLERSDANLKHRLAELEERLTELEKRLSLPPLGQRVQ